MTFNGKTIEMNERETNEADNVSDAPFMKLAQEYANGYNLEVAVYGRDGQGRYLYCRLVPDCWR
jgi:hypothetical protein